MEVRDVMHRRAKALFHRLTILRRCAKHSVGYRLLRGGCRQRLFDPGPRLGLLSHVIAQPRNIFPRRLQLRKRLGLGVGAGAQGHLEASSLVANRGQLAL
eukprot:scaffold187707_cov28-Tisochrysis_lutea.AAC.7